MFKAFPMTSDRTGEADSEFNWSREHFPCEFWFRVEKTKKAFASLSTRLHICNNNYAKKE